jgi:glycosyltransferase involved in cell wall biosynthesis
MNVLYVSFHTPGHHSGGGLGLIQSIQSLTASAEVYYIGPHVEDAAILAGVRKTTYLARDSFAQKVRNALLGVTSGYYSSWRKAIAAEHSPYDYAWLEMTRNGFAARSCKKRCGKLIVRAHNVDYDYVKNCFAKARTPRLLFKYLLVKRQERTCVRLADIVVCLSAHDRDRLCELYGEAHRSKMVILPVCLAPPEYGGADAAMNKGKPYILITGALWYGSNADGILWFLRHVWRHISPDIDLIIAGASPSDKLREATAAFRNVTLADTPGDIGPYFRGARLYVAPIFDGAGMKVKVAEALSYGLPVVGTGHAFIGYDADHACSRACHTGEEFVAAIRELWGLSALEMEAMRENAKMLFEEQYSIARSIACVSEILKRGEQQ